MDFCDFLTLPPALIGATTGKLAARFFDLTARQLATQTRAGCHPSGVNNPANVEPDKEKREALYLSLQDIEREMIAIQHEISKRREAILSCVPLGLWDKRYVRPDAEPFYPRRAQRGLTR